MDDNRGVIRAYITTFVKCIGTNSTHEISYDQSIYMCFNWIRPWYY